MSFKTSLEGALEAVQSASIMVLLKVRPTSNGTCLAVWGRGGIDQHWSKE